MTRQLHGSGYDESMGFGFKFCVLSNADKLETLGGITRSTCSRHSLSVLAGFIALCFVSASVPLQTGRAATYQHGTYTIEVSSPEAVVELFTSQGCSSCPPADRLMNELSKQKELVAVTLPIQYWDYLGWKDTFATAENTHRQQAYANYFGEHKYTPQMVINGKVDLIGSKRAKVMNEIAVRTSQDPFPISLGHQLKAETLTIQVPLAPEDLRGIRARLVAITYSSEEKEVRVRKGENKGRTIAYSNVADSLNTLQEYAGYPISHDIPVANLVKPEADACAVLLQDKSNGAIVGALKITASE